ncbi:MAG TPA: 3-hydroxy-5-phosphonooxypentane-2,4-dione thiolase, partial [Thermodesulfobacteriota bacterium]|nr:3-hydroxy-5-phosphonooxypentane-2,4-dione thiolase [Thermodesulfobacteriota bacterium]
EKVVRSCPVPIVVAGGKKIPEKDALELSYNAVQSGAVGVDMGRNIFQAENPVAMIQAVREVVHNKATVKQALDLYASLSTSAGGGGKKKAAASK